MSTIKSVAIAGASGNVGKPILEALLRSKKFAVTVFTRASSTATFPSEVKIAKVDYESVDSLTQALRGQDAFISTIATMGLGVDMNLISASIAADVKRFIPSSFGSDLENPLVRQLPVFGQKAKVEDRLKEVAKQHPDFTYTIVYNTAFLDWGLQMGFLFSTKDFSPMMAGGGDRPLTTTTLSDVATATANILLHPEETKNRVVRIQSIVTSQKEFLEISKRLTPGQEWHPVNVDLKKMKADSDAKLASGHPDEGTWIGYLAQALFEEGYGGKMDQSKLDNELLGIKPKTPKDIEDILKGVLQK